MWPWAKAREARSVAACLALALVLAAWPGSAAGGYKDTIGYTQLQAELGTATPNGKKIKVSQIEANFGTGLVYMPDTTGDPLLAGKYPVAKSGNPSSPSYHATIVAEYFYGSTSTAPSLTSIQCWEVNDWLSSGFLHRNSYSLPEIETQRIQNHSWVGSTGTVAGDTEIIQRFDYAINRDGFVAVVGVDNVDSTVVPSLMAQSYNAISVGLSNGINSHGYTTFDTPGRIKPDLVAPPDNAKTSYAAGLVSAVAADLLQVADNTPGLGNASHNPQVIKAILMAGARKNIFPTWDRTTTRPLDDRYGAGEVNVYNSYHILTAGEFAASPSSTVGATGWDLGTASSGAGSQLYFFDVPENSSDTLSATLAWNRTIGLTPNGNMLWSSPVPTVANLDMRLYNVSGESTLGSLVDASLSTVDNVELIYQTALQPGRYAIEVSSGNSYVTTYGLAWQSTVTQTGQGTIWTGGMDNTWSSSTNWNGQQVPDGDQAVVFSNSSNTTIDVGANRLLKSISFQTGQVGAFVLNGYTITLSNGGSVNINSNVAAPQTINSNLAMAGSASLVNSSVNAGVSLNLGGSITSAAASGVSTLTLDGQGNGLVSGGISDGLTGGKVALLKTGAGTWSLTGQTGYTGNTTVQAGWLQLGSLNADADTTVMAGAKLTADSIRQRQLAVYGTAAIRENTMTPGVSRVATLTLGGVAGAWTGKLDLANNDLIITGGSLGDVRDQIVTAALHGGATVDWAGNGITTSVATPGTGLGYGTAGDLGLTTFDGLAVDPASVLVKYTLLGDADLNGTVNFSDFLRLQAGYGHTGTMWGQGDFNYDGQVNFSDFLLLQAGYGKTLSAGDVAAPAPEPATLGLLAMGALALLRRRHVRAK